MDESKSAEVETAEVKSEPEKEVVHCKNCGAKLYGDFCSECGTFKSPKTEHIKFYFLFYASIVALSVVCSLLIPTINLPFILSVIRNFFFATLTASIINFVFYLVPNAVGKRKRIFSGLYNLTSFAAFISLIILFITKAIIF